MKQRMSNFWVRLAAYLISALSLVGFVASVLGMIIFSIVGSKEDALAMGYDNIAKNYSAYIMSNFAEDREEVVKQMEKTNFYYAVVKSESSEEITFDIYNRENYLFSNLPENMEGKEGFSWDYELEGNPEVYLGYNIKNFMSALNECRRYGDLDYSQAKINGVVYDLTEGIFYMDTRVGYFQIDYLSVNAEGMQYDYRLEQKNDGNKYVNGYYGIELDPTTYSKWSFVKIESNRYYANAAEGVAGLEFVNDNSEILDYIRTDDWYIYNENKIAYDDQPVNNYKVVGIVDDSLQKQDLFWEWEQSVTRLYTYEEHVITLEVVFGCVFLLGLIFLLWTANGQKDKLRFYHKTPLIISLGCVVMAEIGFSSLYVMAAEALYYATEFSIPLKTCVMLMIELAILMVLIFLATLSNLATRIKTKCLFRYSELYYITRPFVRIRQLARENLSLLWKVTLGMVIIDLAELLVVVNAVSELVVMLFVLYKILQLAIVILMVFQMERLQKGSSRIANGDLSQPIDTSKMVWEFKKHGENINKVGEGISKAVDNQLKSERFKTELITNVSHDIKTPLTSIINYVDLMKKQEITDPTLCEYVEVLDRQSGRLKKLIEDLMEASKASTGNLKVELEECDISMLMGQVAGEFEDRFTACGLETVITKPQMPIYVMADGRHLWRVLDNLMTNICKYSLPNSRVYIDLEQKENQVVIQFKNISKSQLNISSEELMERFVRGDSSRNTEGSGLGLSIAQSLTELMGGTMSLEIDGDLFKVILTYVVMDMSEAGADKAQVQ